MRFGEIYDYRNAEEAKQYIGKKGLFSENLMAICKASELGTYVGILERIVSEDEYPFKRKPKEGGPIIRNQFFRPVVEEAEELMTNRQLSEWIAKGNGEFVIGDGMLVATDYSYSKSSVDKPVPDRVLIRRWKDTEWSKPIRTIYEEDC